MKVRILISIWDKGGVYAMSYDSSKDPATTIESNEDAPEVDDQIMFRIVDEIVNEAIKED